MEHKVEIDEEKRPPNDNRQRRSVESTPRIQPPVQKAPGFWKTFRETNLSKTATLWSCLGAVVLTMVVGFWWGGWVTNATAQKMVSDGVKSAVTSRLANICVAQFNLDATKDQKLTELKALSSYQQGEYTGKQGWATFADDEKPNSQVAGQCAKLIVEANP